MQPATSAYCAEAPLPLLSSSARQSLGRESGPGPAGKHRWCPPCGPSPSSDLAFSREPFAGRAQISRSHRLRGAQGRIKGSKQFWPQADVRRGQPAHLFPSLVSPFLQIPPARSLCALSHFFHNQLSLASSPPAVVIPGSYQPSPHHPSPWMPEPPSKGLGVQSIPFQQGKVKESKRNSRTPLK